MDLCRSLTPRTIGADQSIAASGQLRAGEFSLSSINTNPFLTYELSAGERPDALSSTSTNPFSEDLSRTPTGALPFTLRESPPTDPDATPLAPEPPSSATGETPLALDSVARAADQQLPQPATPAASVTSNASASFVIGAGASTVASNPSLLLHAQSQPLQTQLAAAALVPTSTPLPSQAAAVGAARDVQSQKSRVFIAKYDYDPIHQSPNENPELELPLAVGDHILVFGEMDDVRTTQCLFFLVMYTQTIARILLLMRESRHFALLRRSASE